VTVYTLDPLRDARWPEFLELHESASVFHSVSWLEAIRDTYGYEPVVYTTSAPGTPLTNGVLLCRIRSWITGRRMVSLPFSDHCDPLLDTPESTAALAAELRNGVAGGKWKYIELRPFRAVEAGEGAATMPVGTMHMLDLRPAKEKLFRATHKTAIQQKVHRAEREGVQCEVGNSEKLLQAFYRLQLLTRRRHQLPPQPIEWFRNVAKRMGGQLQIRVAYHSGKEVAAMLMLFHKKTIVYKYRWSDAEYSNLGATQLLLWNAVAEAKSAGMVQMDYGRSDADNEGLITYKNRWGATCFPLSYARWSLRPAAEKSEGSALSGVAKRIFAVMPDALLETTGRILYRHVG
jgi:CelD/BcsL family acetyltransferase involved in cellulose biosynthesis